MASLFPTELHSIEIGTQGWTAILNTNMERLNGYLHKFWDLWDTSACQHGDILVYDSSQDMWIHQQPDLAGGGGANFEPGTFNNDLLFWDGALGKYQSRALGENDVTNAIAQKIQGMYDLWYHAGVSDGEVLRYDGAQGRWEAQSLSGENATLDVCIDVGKDTATGTPKTKWARLTIQDGLITDVFTDNTWIDLTII